MSIASSSSQTIGVVIMTYGSATTAEYVPEYLGDIYKGGVPAGLIEDFAERYRLVGQSPLIEITKAQAAKLEEFLNGLAGEERAHYIVQAAMLHSKPSIDEAVATCYQGGAGRLVGIILSPQFSSFIMEGYLTALKVAAVKHGFDVASLSIVGPWPTEPHFIKLLATRVRGALAKLHSEYGQDVPVVFTTHSLPQRVVDRDPSYLDQLQATIGAIVGELNMPGLKWFSAYQSAGHTPEPWLKPDLVDVLAGLRNKRLPVVLIVPIQFLADHLEVLYDLDIAAAKQCQEYGIRYKRTELPNADSQFIEALANLVKDAV